MIPRARITEAQLALMVLTRLPAGTISGDAPPVARAAWAFPLVGILTGALSGLVYGAATLLGLPPLASALLAIAAGVLLTGGLHEDGLADVADGFGGGLAQARKLEIMRDSRIGSYGVVALVLVLGLTATGIAGHGTLWNFIAVGAISRAAMLLPMAFLPPARKDGLGQAAALRPGPCLAAPLTVTAALTLAILSLAPLVAALAATLLMMALARRQIGG